MEKKDVKNYETYPIWKIESGRMLHKYELFAEEARILHRAIPTVSHRNCRCEIMNHLSEISVS